MFDFGILAACQSVIQNHGRNVVALLAQLVQSLGAKGELRTIPPALLSQDCSRLQGCYQVAGAI